MASGRLEEPMWLRLILCLTLVQLFLCAGEQKHKSKPAVLQVTDFKAQQNGETVSFEGRVRNVSDGTVRQVKLSFELIAPDESVVSKRSGALESDELAPGEEATFAFEMPWNPRAVRVKVGAKGLQSKEIAVSGEGPYRIE